MKTLSYSVGKENAIELKKVLRDLTELHDRLANILGDCEVYTNEYEGEKNEVSS